MRKGGCEKPRGEGGRAKMEPFVLLPFLFLRFFSNFWPQFEAKVPFSHMYGGQGASRCTPPSENGQ